MTITIRRAAPSDAESLARFAARTFADTFAHANTADDMALHLTKTYSPEQQLDAILDPAVDVLVVEDGEHLAGYAQLRDAPAPDCVGDHPAIEIWRFYVDRPWHGRGVAQSLMAASIDAARTRGARVVWLSVWSLNERAKSFYMRAGFRQVGMTTFVLGTDVQDDWVMAMTLEPAPLPDSADDMAE